MVFAPLSAHHDARVVGWRRHHAEHFARSGFDSHNAANLSFEQTLAKFLQLDVNSQRQVLAGHGSTVELSILIVSLNTPVGVAQKYLHALFSTKLFFIATFYAQFADVIARLIIVGVLHIAFRDLGHVAQNVCGVGVLVLSDASFLNVETRETEYLFLENAELFIRKLTHKHLFGKARIAWIFVAVLDIVHAFDEIFLGNAQGIAKFHRV